MLHQLVLACLVQLSQRHIYTTFIKQIIPSSRNKLPLAEYVLHSSFIRNVCAALADAANLQYVVFGVTLACNGATFFWADCNICFCAGISGALSSVLNMTCFQRDDRTVYTILDRPPSVDCFYNYRNATVSNISFLTRHNLRARRSNFGSIFADVMD